ncbi:MAG: CpaF family protein [Eubacterium sp.]|nr:CpaF family protein [Eubacterium sp.]
MKIIYRRDLAEIRKIFSGLSAFERETFTEDSYREIIENMIMKEDALSAAEMKEIVDLIYARTRSRLGVLMYLVNDSSVNEIMVNGTDNVFIETGGGISRVKSDFDSTDELEEIIRNIAASCRREINEMNPILDARLENGSRVNAVYRNVAYGGPVLTIRKFSDERITIERMVQEGTLTEECRDMLKALVESGYNILISGGTSSGKTTFLNALTDFIPSDERVIVIEDSRELMLGNIDDLVQMECHTANSQGNGEVTMDMLIRTSLRMRPDRIIVGEVRGREVAMMLQAMNTGHDGSITTGHGNSAAGMLRRLEAMYLMSEEIPLEAVRAQILEGIDICIHLSRMRGGERKVTEVSELTGYKDGEYVLNKLFRLDKNMRLIRENNSLMNREKLERRGSQREL